MILFHVGIVILSAVFVQAVDDVRKLSQSLVLSEANIKDCYDGLNANKDSVLNFNDLHIHYYHKDTDFAKEKFMDLVDTKNKDGKVSMEELTTFLKLRHITDAVFECTYVHSESLREYCLADQVLTYVLLVIDSEAVNLFYNTIDVHKSDGGITAGEVADLIKYVPEFTTSEQESFIMQLGGDDGIISELEFKDAVEHEELQDDFRRCRKELNGFKGIYDIPCLIKELLDHYMNDLTEYEIALLFEEHDDNEDGQIVKSDLLETKQYNEASADKLIKLMDKTGDSSVSYGEFRTYLKVHTVRMQLEKECSEVHKSAEAELECYMTKTIQLVEENHTPIWMKNVDLDTVILFEHLDTNDDGMIQGQTDLIKERKWGAKIANKMLDEINSRKEASLEEIMEYIGYPNMVYALNDCLYIKRSTGRTTCYEKELKDVVFVMLEKIQVEAFFNFFDTDKNKKILRSEVEDKGITGDDAENFLVEMGMGDMEITYLEFSWFVRQQRIGHMFEESIKTPKTLLPILKKYIDEVMTEHDTQVLFAMLDKDKNWELDTTDFTGHPEAVVILVKAMDAMSEDQDHNVNFYEFWLFLNTPLINPRKTQLEESCTKPNKRQADELKCYAKEIVNVT